MLKIHVKCAVHIFRHITAFVSFVQQHIYEHICNNIYLKLQFNLGLFRLHFDKCSELFVIKYFILFMCFII